MLPPCIDSSPPSNFEEPPPCSQHLTETLWITPTTKTLIDNIFYNNASNNISSGNITTLISDHLTQFLLVPDQPKDIQSHKLKEVSHFTILIQRHLKKTCKELTRITSCNFPLKAKSIFPTF